MCILRKDKGMQSDSYDQMCIDFVDIFSAKLKVCKYSKSYDVYRCILSKDKGKQCDNYDVYKLCTCILSKDECRQNDSYM